MDKNYKLTKLSAKQRHAYNACYAIAKSQYENFPVASFLLPIHLRRSILAIYAFARCADNIADEGDLPSDMRLELMTKFEANLYDIQYGKPPTEPIFIALSHTIECFNLPMQHFYDLLTAFRQDILKNRYRNFAEIQDYCAYSANPIGRLLLHLSGQATTNNLYLSDLICTGLQLINFIQDIDIDLVGKNRCYIPQDEIQEYGVNVFDPNVRATCTEYAALIQKQVHRAKDIYMGGMALGNKLPGFFGLEIRFIIECGYKILERLCARTNIEVRPKISKLDLFLVLIKILCTQPQYRSYSTAFMEKSCNKN